jgi:hypothetical protein
MVYLVMKSSFYWHLPHFVTDAHYCTYAESSAYKSGYKHDVSDASPNRTTLYLEEPGKGLAFHTQKFNQGYIDGFCSIVGKNSSSDSDARTFYCSEDATQFKGK